MRPDLVPCNMHVSCEREDMGMKQYCLGIPCLPQQINTYLNVYFYVCLVNFVIKSHMNTE